MSVNERQTMKKIILGMTVLAVAAAGLQTTRAGDREWAVAGKILTGLFVASAINHAIADEQRCAPVYYSEPAPCRSYSYSYCPPPAPRVVYQQPVYCAPAPVVVYRAPVYYAPAPVCYAPAPVVSFRFGYGGEHRRFQHGRW